MEKGVFVFSLDTVSDSYLPWGLCSQSVNDKNGQRANMALLDFSEKHPRETSR